MARTGWGRHTVVATGSNDATKQVSVNAWNNDLDTDGILGFAAETIASASSVTPTNSFVKLSGSTSIDTIAIANSSEGDLLYVITTGSVTLNNTSSPSSSGDIRLLGDANKDLSTTVPTILMRVSTFWYEYGGSPVTDGSVTNAQLANMAANTIKVRNANSSGVPSDIALATTQILIGDGTGFTAAALSGDVSMDNTGDVTVGTLNQSTTGSSASCTGNSATVTTNANLTGGVTSVGNAATVITNANLTGGVTSVGNAATVVTNANLTGDVTSSGNATTLGTVAVAKGGTNLTSYTAGDIVYASGTTTLAKLNVGSDTNVLTLAGGVPTWAAPASSADTPWTVVHDFDTYYYDMQVQTKPADPAADNGRFYVKEIDTNNDGVFCLIRKNGAFEETQIV